MHSGMSWWTDQSIEWFERASSSCDYHRRLVNCIEDHIKKDESILEPGCGLGYEAELLSDDGFSIQAFDNEEKAIKAAQERTGKDIYFCSDAKQVQTKADTVLCINFGHIENTSDLKTIASHAKKKIIYIISRHSGHGQDTRPDRTEEICRILEDAGYSYEKEEIQLEFNQPLRSFEEAEDFIAWTYLGKNKNEYLRFLKGSEDPEYPFVFKNRKSLVLFEIKTK